ncbi:DNRLRE domain-containing protein [Chitinophaga agri]|uniref:DNRLRE domain-containing protein n=1 Tax=Chitinophaga agri TaxID=2703787 RepID=A0A6B9ZPD7_9BACT|nr:DNRLRE domain-containing protein [Chitinophaga agri]QHS63806.1 DNRLRE domain-containing protein [Chitinophaga agri]
MRPPVLALGLLLSTLTGYSQTTLTFRPDSCNGKDATVFVKTNLPAWSDKNFGHRDELSASGWTYGGQGGEDGYSRTFIDFTQLRDIPRGTRVSQATLSLYGKESSIFIKQGNTGPNDCFIDRITSPWSEDSVTWNKRPSISFMHQTALQGSRGEAQTWNYHVTVDVTALVQDMIDLPADSSHGFCIRLQKETYYVNLAFASSEYVVSTLRPALTLVFNSCDTVNLAAQASTTKVARTSETEIVSGPLIGNVRMSNGGEGEDLPVPTRVSAKPSEGVKTPETTMGNQQGGPDKKAVKTKKK